MLDEDENDDDDDVGRRQRRRRRCEMTPTANDISTLTFRRHSDAFNADKFKFASIQMQNCKSGVNCEWCRKTDENLRLCARLHAFAKRRNRLCAFQRLHTFQKKKRNIDCSAL